jgi:hypothetical protein
MIRLSPQAHVPQREFAERFLPRRELKLLMRRARSRFTAGTAISEHSVSAWLKDLHHDGKGPGIWIDLSGFTHAEFDLVLNTIANQLQAHSKGRIH